MKRAPIYGTMAEFDSPTALVAAAHRTHEAGYQKVDAYSPFPIEGLAEAVGFHKNRVPLVTLIGGLIGGLVGISAAVLDFDQQLSGQRWRQALSLVAGVHHRDF